MAQTQTTPLVREWTLLVAGPCIVTMTPDSPDGFWALREDAGAPADTVLGHHLTFKDNTSLELRAGTRLYTRGRSGNVSWSQDPA